MYCTFTVPKVIVMRITLQSEYTAIDHLSTVNFMGNVQWRKTFYILSISIDFFQNSVLYKNANITSFVLAVLLKINQSNKMFTLKM